TPTDDDGWTGIIQTLSINAKVRLVPNDNRNTGHAPAFLLFFGRMRTGESWHARTDGAGPKDYLRVTLDDPSSIAPNERRPFPFRWSWISATCLEPAAKTIKSGDGGSDFPGGAACLICVH